MNFVFKVDTKDMLTVTEKAHYYLNIFDSDNGLMVEQFVYIADRLKYFVGRAPGHREDTSGGCCRSDRGVTDLLLQKQRIHPSRILCKQRILRSGVKRKPTKHSPV